MTEPDAYDQVIAAFEDAYEVELDPPDLDVDPYRVTVDADPDEYALTVGPLPYAYMEQDVFQDRIHGAFRDLYDAALETAVDRHADEIEELYAGIDADVAVRNQFFTDLNEDDDDSAVGNDTDRYTNGKYSSSSKTVKIDDRFLSHIDPETHRVETEKLDQLIRHECIHGLHYGTNPHVSTLSDHVSDTSDNYTKDVRRASIEAITRFEQYRIHDRDSKREARYRKLRDPWNVPGVFADHTGMDEYGDDLFDNPYRLGHFAAHAIDAAFQEEYGDETGRELTREFLACCVTTPAGLVGAVEASFAMRGLPYYPNRVEAWEDWLSRRDQPEEQAEHMLDGAITLFESLDAERPQIAAYYEAHALLHAAEQDWITEAMQDWVEMMQLDGMQE